MATYSTNTEGKFIPASQRPDGTWRKARRVKEGYVPQEEVPLYESKGKQFAQRKSIGLPPGLCPEVVETSRRCEKKERTKVKNESAAEAASHQQIPGVLKMPANSCESKAIMNGDRTRDNADHTMAKSNDATKTMETLTKNLGHKFNIQDDAQDLQKKYKKFNKKLREIDEIEKKIKSGALKKPEKDQLDKVARKTEIEKELEQLLVVLVKISGTEAIESLTPTLNCEAAP